MRATRKTGLYSLALAICWCTLCLAGGHEALAAKDSQQLPGGASVLRIYDGKQPDRFLGLGFVVDSRGHALTCLHSVARAETLLVRVAGDAADDGCETIQVAGDRDLDVAILKVKREGLKHFLLGSGVELGLSAPVQTVGYVSSGGQGPSLGVTPVMSGIVKDKIALDNGALVLETDMVCEEDCGGGPLLNDSGHVVGICGVKPMGFAAARPVIQALAIDDLKLFLRQNGVGYAEPGVPAWAKVMWVALAAVVGTGLYVGAYYVQGRIIELKRRLSDKDSWIALLTSMTLHIVLIVLVAVVLWVRSRRDLDSIQAGAAVDVVMVRPSSATDGDTSGGDAQPQESTVEFDDLKPTTTKQPIAPTDVTKMVEQKTQERINEIVQKAGRKAAAGEAKRQAAANAALAGALKTGTKGQAANVRKGLDALKDKLAKAQQGVPQATQERRARWLIAYNLMKSEKCRFIDLYGAELALCLSGDSFVYVRNVSGSPRKRMGNISSDTRMWWLPMDGRTFGCGEEEIFRRVGHACPPGSQVVLFFPASFEQKLLDLERRWWENNRGKYEEGKIQQTEYRIMPGSLELTVTRSF